MTPLHDTRLLLATVLVTTAVAAGQPEKAAALTQKGSPTAKRSLPFSPPTPGGSGFLTQVGSGDTQLPVVVVSGTPYDMGYHLGRLTRESIQQFIPAALQGIQAEMQVTSEQLQAVWARTSAYSDDRVEQELLGLAEGSGVPLGTLQAVHAIPLLMPYSCSSIAAWGDATADHHLYQTRNLDWSKEIGAHEFPVIAVYRPTTGIAHVLPTFAGMIGANTGMNLRGIVLSEMGDAPAREMPYNLYAPHFTVYFRTMLYDADSLTRALDIFKAQPQTKRYHFVFGDGRSEHRAVKLATFGTPPAPPEVRLWKDNDPSDELAPNILSCLVFQDEGRGAFPALKRDHGTLNAEKIIAVANSIPIKGGNILDVVYDATDLRLWVTYAKGDREAYQRPSTLIDLKTLDADGDGRPDLAPL